MKHIIVNATALASSGGLSILKQFIDEIPEDEFEYILFVSDELKLETSKKNVRFIGKNVKTFYKRFLWDAFGIKKWIKENNINCVAAISLQNTNFRTNKTIPNFIYFHQSIPFFQKKWNPFKSNEKSLWFYKNIYPFFVQLFMNKNTEVFVQSNFIKDGFTEHFDISKDRIHVISPKLAVPILNETKYSNQNQDKINLFYPATPFIYKNHSMLFEAISLIDEELQKKITLTLTCTKEEIGHIIKKSKFNFNINFLGKISFSEVLDNYKLADALVFPSYIETIGLPLLEAASFGLPIITSNLPYAHEVLNSYEGATFVDFDNPNKWSKQISDLFHKKGQIFQPLRITPSNSWPQLFKIVKAKIN